MSGRRILCSRRVEDGVVDYHGVERDAIARVSSQVDFLRWVRQEKERLLARQENPQVVELSPEEKEAAELLKEAHYWFYTAAQLGEPLGRFMIGSLLFDKLIHWDFFCLLRGGGSLEAVKEYPIIDASQMNAEEQRACVEQGYRWLWAAALGSNSVLEPSTTLPPSEEVWNSSSSSSQCGMAWHDLGAIHFRDETVPTLASKLFTVAAERHGIAEGFFWLGFIHWPSNWMSIPSEERTNHPAFTNMLLGKSLILWAQRSQSFRSCRKGQWRFDVLPWSHLS